jgi:alpha/beta superfamily hydrolase
LWDFNICSFDFSGAGYSEGDYVTLGFFEKDDIKAVVDFLRKEFGIQK